MASELYPTVGASGGVFGLLLAYAVYFPHNKLFLLFLPIPIPARVFVVIYAAIELVPRASRGTQAGVAHFAHLGGLCRRRADARVLARVRAPVLSIAANGVQQVRLAARGGRSSVLKEHSMRRRLYYLLPDAGSARKIMDDLLLARIEERHIHFLAGQARRWTACTRPTCCRPPTSCTARSRAR